MSSFLPATSRRPFHVARHRSPSGRGRSRRSAAPRHERRHWCRTRRHAGGLVKIGVFDPVFGSVELDPMLDRIVELGIEAVEVGTGNYPGDHHCKPAALLADADARKRFGEAFSSRGLTISALSCHGNPVHPDPDRAAHDDEVYRDTVRLAGELGIGVVNLFSGCPGDGPNATRPNWVTCTWPPEYAE